MISTIQIEYDSLGVQTNTILAVMDYSSLAATFVSESINTLSLSLIACFVYSVQRTKPQQILDTFRKSFPAPPYDIP